MNNNDRVLALAKRYLLEADRYCRILSERAGTSLLLRAWRQHQIPPTGAVVAGVAYRFHGIGCAFEGEGVHVDVDFPSDGEWDAFDAWRLALFASTQPDFLDLNDPKSLEPILERLEECGASERTSGAPSAWRLRR